MVGQFFHKRNEFTLQYSRLIHSQYSRWRHAPKKKKKVGIRERPSVRVLQAILWMKMRQECGKQIDVVMDSEEDKRRAECKGKICVEKEWRQVQTALCCQRKNVT